MKVARRDEKQPRAARRRAAVEPKSRAAPLPDTGWFWIILSCAFLVRLLYLLEIDSIPLFYHLAGDGRAYDEWGQKIAAGDWLGQGVFYQAPLYPYFLGFLQVVLGHNLWLIRLIQIGLGAISCALIFQTGRKLFSRQAGIAAGLILSFYAPGIFFDGLIEKSILDFFLLSLLLWLVSQLKTTAPWSQWLAVGAVLGLLGLSRENALILATVLPLWIGLYFSAAPVVNRWRWIGLFFAGLLLVLVPVGLRNMTVGGEFKLTTSQFGPNFFIGNNPLADGTYVSVGKVIGEPQLEGKDAKRLAERDLGRSLTPGEMSDYWLQKSRDYIRSQPGQWLGLIGKKWLLVWNAREIEDSDDFYIYQQWSWLLSFLGWLNHFGILAPLAAVGLWLTRHQWRRVWLLYTMIIALALSVAIFYVFGRYRFPLVPLLALFAGAGLVESVKLWKQQDWLPLVLGLAVFGVASVVANWPLDGSRSPGPGGYNNLANAFYKEGRVQEAISTALKAIELQPSYGVAHYNLGNLNAARGRFDLAQTHFEEALRLFPNYADAYSNFGQLIAERGDIEAGIRYFRKAIELNPSLSRAHLNLGVALAKQGRIEEAVGPLQEAARLAPESAETRNYLGSLFAAQGRYDDAAVFFRDALRIQPDYAQAHQGLAQLLLLQGRKEEAAVHYQAALRLMKQKGAAANLR
jgi:Flp pilus assembly protein TadD/4-amino-4-deoxy-L-arabinose transferase-like glycosyltransferase